MDIEDKLNKIIEYQNDNSVHPLTCGNDSSHTPLIPILQGDNIVLICADCSYSQSYIPDIIFNKGRSASD